MSAHVLPLAQGLRQPRGSGAPSVVSPACHRLLTLAPRLFSDSGQLHQGAYVSRIEDVVRVLIEQKKLEAADLERIWKVRRGRRLAAPIVFSGIASQDTQV